MYERFHVAGNLQRRFILYFYFSQFLYQNRAIVERILWPLVEVWSHEQMISILKNNVHLLTPKVNMNYTYIYIFILKFFVRLIPIFSFGQLIR